MKAYNKRQFCTKPKMLELVWHKTNNAEACLHDINLDSKTETRSCHGTRNKIDKEMPAGTNQKFSNPFCGQPPVPPICKMVNWQQERELIFLQALHNAEFSFARFHPPAWERSADRTLNNSQLPDSKPATDLSRITLASADAVGGRLDALVMRLLLYYPFHNVSFIC